MPTAIETYRLPALATCAYLLMYYGFIINQVRVRAKLAKEESAAEREKLNPQGVPYMQHNADRGVGNTLEQMGPFVISMWMYAALVDADFAGVLGFVYVATRSLYYVLFHPPKWRVLFSTLPNYLVIAYFIVAVAVKAL